VLHLGAWLLLGEPNAPRQLRRHCGARQVWAGESSQSRAQVTGRASGVNCTRMLDAALAAETGRRRKNAPTSSSARYGGAPPPQSGWQDPATATDGAPPPTGRAGEAPSSVYGRLAGQAAPRQRQAATPQPRQAAQARPSIPRRASRDARRGWKSGDHIWHT
jgi:hypothetical protein